MDRNELFRSRLVVLLSCIPINCILRPKTIFLTHPDKFHSDQFESLGLETFDDLADKSTLYTVGLDHDKSAFGIRVAHG